MAAYGIEFNTPGANDDATVAADDGRLLVAMVDDYWLLSAVTLQERMPLPLPLGIRSARA